MLPFLLLLANAAPRSGFPPLPPPAAYLRPADQELARHPRPGSFPCEIHRIDLGTPVIGELPTDQCYKMLPPKRVRGIWLDIFEGSQFLPGATRRPLVPLQSKGPRIWLEVDRVNLPHQFGSSKPHIVLLEFIGRRTMFRVPSGHFGMSDYAIIVDKVISARDLP